MIKTLTLLGFLFTVCALNAQSNQPALQEKYKMQIAGGATSLAIGGAIGAGAVIYHFVGSYYGTTDGERSNNKLSATIAIGATGGAFAIGGAVLLGLGMHNKKVYERDNKSVSLNLTGNRAGVTLTF